MEKREGLSAYARQLRRLSLQMTTKAGSGHPTSCLSSADILAALFFREMRYDPKHPEHPGNDTFILSKGHAAPLLYAALSLAGCTTADPLTLRRFGSAFEGHPVPSKKLPWIRFATGSLGQGLSIGAGSALAAKRSGSPKRTYVLLGDGELAEGSNYEALQLASTYHLSNLCAIADINRLGQSQQTQLGHDIDAYVKRFEAFGWRALAIDGHDLQEIIAALAAARQERTRPTVILAKTFKGKGVSFLEDKEGWHGKALSDNELERALKELPPSALPKAVPNKPLRAKAPSAAVRTDILIPYRKGASVSTREAYGMALARLAQKNPQVIAIDGEVKNSTFAADVEKAKPKQFVQAYIAEQNMIGMAQGMADAGHKVFASSFAAFLTRAHDQLRMAALGGASFAVVGSHAGVAIGEDGASQMGLDDIALFRGLPASSVFCPSDAVSAARITAFALRMKGIVYLRMGRPKVPVLYSNAEQFKPGGFKVLRHSPVDTAVLVGTGMTVHEALKAQELVADRGMQVAVVDAYSIKPFDAKGFAAFAKTRGKRAIVVEDHFGPGGLGEMLSAALQPYGIRVESMHVQGIPHSATPEQELRLHGIDARHIAAAALRRDIH